jgi:hypothetical protein
VDDIYVLVVGKFPNTVSGLIQWALHTIEKWCNKVGLFVNPNKTGLIVLTRRKLPGFFEPPFFWGYFTSLCVDQVSQGSFGFLANSECACGCQGKEDSQFAVGLRPEAVHWLHISIIRPSITFAPLVWWPHCWTASAKKRLNSVQRLAYLGITRAMLTTPTSAMEALTCLPPLELLVQNEARSAAHHL